MKPEDTVGKEQLICLIAQIVQDVIHSVQKIGDVTALNIRKSAAADVNGELFQTHVFFVCK